ncbi:hypothetical protein [Alicyclobacillus sp. ALC3]|uniref:hypothetical protein n=1 Tax=Alicyclobacillus sp. ALC3 TaxID=2796143 RepID=UPI002379B444|nr:hypothetical protein [Alicyclobacillus sp. ALC3]WDL96391.1 hypothetical protein JC200_19005 [Alicyclobacillus sp. ALC3]
MTQTVAQGRIADRSTECRLTASRRAVYLACEDMDLVWDAADVKIFDRACKG